MIIGEGVVPLKECLEILNDARYQSYLSIEYEAAEDSKTGLEKSLSNLRKALSELQFADFKM